MKTKFLLLLCVIIFGMGNINLTRADDNSLATVTDVVLVRPGCFVATVFGSVIFVIALPFAAASHSVGSTADTLVLAPWHATVTRPIGDFSTIE